jgi:hypothetical protein
MPTGRWVYTGTMQDDKPTRLYFKTYLQMIHNAVGTQMFRNFYVVKVDGTEIDSLDDGDNSCAFFVSSVVTLMKKAAGVHGTIKSTVADLQNAGWHGVAVDRIRPGDVIVWQAKETDDGKHGHIGFYIGNGRAISTSSSQRQVVEHDVTYGGARPVIQALRCDDWDVT